MKQQEESSMTNMIRGLGHLSFRVSHFEDSFFHATCILGLREVLRSDGTSYLTNDEHHHTVELIPADQNALDHIGLEAESEQALEEVYTKLEREGVHPLISSSHEPGLSHALRFQGPGGHVFEVYIPSLPEALSSQESDPRARRIGHITADALYNGPGVRPRNLGHAMLKCENVPEMEHFLGHILGFRLSDRIGNDIVWMRCGPDHHTLNIVRGPSGLHHYAWEVESWADLERMGDHLLANDMTYIWGPGRHGPGNNLFSYHLDPAGVVIEYFADLLRIEDESTYQPLDWPNTARTLNQWGPGPAPDFFDHGVNLFSEIHVAH